MKVWYATSADCLVTRIILNEIGIPADYELDASYKTPTLVLENGLRLMGHAVIMVYLADHYQARNLLPELNDFQRYRVLEWVQFIAMEMQKTFEIVFHPDVPATLKTQVFVPALLAKLDYTNQYVQEHSCLVGHHFTLADAYLYVMLYWATLVNLDLSRFESITRYKEQLEKRPSIVDAFMQEGLNGVF